MIALMAIDPGAAGGIAWTDGDGSIQCIPMPATEGEVLNHLRSLVASGLRTAVIEEVGGYCGVGMPGSRMFTFGRGFGFLLGCLQTMGVAIVLAKPAKWQKHFSLGTVKSSGGKTLWKRKLAAEAARRFPTANVTLKTADALLILEYGRSRS